MRKNITKKTNQTKPTIHKSDSFNLAVVVTIIVVTFLFFAKSVKYEFTNWDDHSYILTNPLIKDFSLSGIIKILTTPVIGMYNPVPFLLYSIIHSIAGINPKYFHLLNIALHLIATGMVYKFIHALTRRWETAAICTIIFALHPMHVSVVVWASQTKTSLFAIFYLLGLYNYTQYTRNEKLSYLMNTMWLMALAVLSKPTAVSFPLILCLIDYYTNRISADSIKKLLLEKIPFFLISIIFAVVTLLTHLAEKDNIFDVNHQYSFWNSILVSNYSLGFYIEKFFYPMNLSALYSYPDATNGLPVKYFIALFYLPIMGYLIYRFKPLRKDLIFGSLFFILSISVVLRIVPSGIFPYATRYSYIPYIGLSFIIGQVISLSRSSENKYLYQYKNHFIAGLAVFLVFCFWRTSIRIERWQNSITLFSDVIAKDPNSYTAYMQRSLARQDKGDILGALTDINKSIELHPEDYNTFVNRGGLKIKAGDHDGAIADLTIAIRLNGNNAEAYTNRAIAEYLDTQTANAVADVDTALRNNNHFGPAYLIRGLIKVNQGDTVGARTDWQRADQLGVPNAKKIMQQYQFGKVTSVVATP